MFAVMVRELNAYIEERYRSWRPVVTVVVGYEDDDDQAAALLSEPWVARS